MNKRAVSDKPPQGQKSPELHFVATIRVAISNVVDPETFRDHYGNDAKAALLAIFDSPVEIVINGDKVRLVSASAHLEAK